MQKLYQICGAGSVTHEIVRRIWKRHVTIGAVLKGRLQLHLIITINLTFQFKTTKFF